MLLDTCYIMALFCAPPFHAVETISRLHFVIKLIWRFCVRPLFGRVSSWLQSMQRRGSAIDKMPKSLESPIPNLYVYLVSAATVSATP